MVECNIDDMSGEIYSYLMPSLLQIGALDVTYQPIQMKKDRPGIKISVLCDLENVSSVEKMLLKETTTFGTRKYIVDRRILDRQFIKHETVYGELTFKYGYLEGELIKITPEYEELKKIANGQKIPLIQVYKEIESFIAKLFMK